jgi:hypothetical protein
MATSSQPAGDLIERLRSVLKSRADIELAVLFGSYAWGRARNDSDVDVAILPLTGADIDASELALQSDLSLATGRDVDLVRLDRASTLLKLQVAKNGLPIVEGHPGAFSRFRAHAAAEYVDFEPSFVLYGERFRRRLAETG